MTAFPEAADIQRALQEERLWKAESLEPLHCAFLDRAINLLEVVKRIDFYTTQPEQPEHPELPL